MGGLALFTFSRVAESAASPCSRLRRSPNRRPRRVHVLAGRQIGGLAMFTSSQVAKSAASPCSRSRGSANRRPRRVRVLACRQIVRLVVRSEERRVGKDGTRG